MKSRSLRLGLKSPVAAEPNNSSFRTPNRRQRSTRAGCFSSIGEVMAGMSQSGYAILVRVHASLYGDDSVPGHIKLYAELHELATSILMYGAAAGSGIHQIRRKVFCGCELTKKSKDHADRIHTDCVKKSQVFLKSAVLET